MYCSLFRSPRLFAITLALFTCATASSFAREQVVATAAPAPLLPQDFAAWHLSAPLQKITDPQQATAAQLAACYHQRWESETAYKSLKTHQRGPRQVLRSQDPDGVAQELYAYLITYQAVRQLMHQAAVAADIDPDRLSFTTALRAVRRFLTSAATATGQFLTCLVDCAISQLLEDRHDRRDRASPRVLKRSQNPYHSKKHATQPVSTTVNYTIEILDPAPR